MVRAEAVPTHREWPGVIGPAGVGEQGIGIARPAAATKLSRLRIADCGLEPADMKNGHIGVGLSRQAGSPGRGASGSPGATEPCGTEPHRRPPTAAPAGAWENGSRDSGSRG